MAQQIIDLGTSANAGDGDNLRSAMDKTNDNFTEVYTAGPVGSNITITNNSISSTNTNGNITLATDGTGVIQVANDIIPDVNNLRYIGNANIRHKGIYVGSAGIISDGPLGLPDFANTTVRDATITTPADGQLVLTDGNVQVYYSNSWSTISGATGGINNVVDDTSPQLGGNLDLNSKNIDGTGSINITGAVTASANVTGAYLIGNGSQLTDVSASSATTAGTVTTAAQPNITSVGTLTSVSVTGNITTTGNITGGNLLIGGDVVPDGNVTMGTGNITSQSGNIVTTSGNISGGNIITGGIVSATGNITSTGNISGGNIIGIPSSITVTTAAASGDGSLVYNNGTGVFTFTPADAGLADYGDANVATFLGSNFGSNTIVTTGNVTAANFIGEVTGNVSGSAATATSATSATTAGTVTTAAQPNITSVGTLGSVTINAQTTTRNLLVTDGASVANPNYVEFKNTDSATGRVNEYYGLKLNRTYTSNPSSAPNQSELGEIAFAWENTGGETIGSSLKAKSDTSGSYGYATWIELGGNVTATFNADAGLDVVGNITASNLIGEVTGNVTGDLTGDVTGNVSGSAATATTAGTVTANAQPNITSVGTLTSVTVTGNVDAGNVNATNVTGDLTGNVTGDLTGNVTGDVTGDLTGDVTGNITSTGTSTFTTVDINGGAIDGVVIGANSAAAGSFTTIDTTGNATVGGNLTVNVATKFEGNATFDTGTEEAFDTLTGSTGTVTHDCNNGHVFYHTGASGDITANFTNLGLTAEFATNLTVIINQGATPYEVTAVQIGGAAQTINWQGGSQPTGNANGIDAFSFTILNDGGTYVVLGQMVDFT